MSICYTNDDDDDRNIVPLLLKFMLLRLALDFVQMWPSSKQVGARPGGRRTDGQTDGVQHLMRPPTESHIIKQSFILKQTIFLARDSI